MHPDLFSQLRPLLGSKADALQIAYAAGDEQTKKNIETLITAISCKAGFGIRPPGDKVAQGKYPIGQVLLGGRPAYTIGLNNTDLFHTGVFGQTGRGKTNAVLILLQQLSKHKVPWLVFDWKRAGYRDLVCDDVYVFTVGRTISPFYFNPLTPPPGVDATSWYKQFIQCISHAYFLGHGCEMILQDVLGKDTPTLADVLRKLNGYPAKLRQLYWLQSTQRAVKALCYGGINDVLNVKNSPPISHWLDKNIILELDALSDSEAKFFVEILMSAIYLYRKEKRHSGLKHACVIEEAHHILPREDKAKESKSVMDKLFREIREYGEALIVVDQMPSTLLPSAIANLSTKISFSLSLDVDVRRVGSAMLLNSAERQWLGRLPVGVALMKLQNRWHAPFFLKIPPAKIQHGITTDEAIAKQTTSFFAKTSLKSPPMTEPQVISPLSPKDKNKQIDKKAQEFLKDILKHPHSTMTPRYKRLQLNPRLGVKIKDHLVQKRMIQEVFVATAKGRVKLAKVTERALEWASSLGVRVARQKSSIEHQYWCARIQDILKKKGYDVFSEARLKTGGVVDVFAVKRGAMPSEAFREGNPSKRFVVVEVETGKSDILANIQKCARLGKVIFAATTKDAKAKIEAQLKKANLQKKSIRTLEARYFEHLQDL